MTLNNIVFELIDMHLQNEGTALHFAAERGRFRIVGYLVASNADIKALNEVTRNESSP